MRMMNNAKKNACWRWGFRARRMSSHRKNGSRVVNIMRVGICHVSPLIIVGVSENTNDMRSAKRTSCVNSRPSTNAPKTARVVIPKSTTRIAPSIGTPLRSETATTRNGPPLGWLSGKRPKYDSGLRVHNAKPFA